MRTKVLPADERSLNTNSLPVSPLLETVALSKDYPSGNGFRCIISNLSLRVEQSQFVSLVGPSGVGKTTLLRCLAGLLTPSNGRVLLHGQSIDGPPKEVAVVFQDYSRSLLPWLRIEDNVSLPLRGKGPNKSERKDRALAALDEVGLSQFARHYPWEVSGGMQQRVAIARALACKPELLLMDEPFASVDAQTRLELEDLLRNIHLADHMTTLFVTHDIDEAVYLSDEVVVLSGSPATVAEVIRIDLGLKRDQITTRSTRSFAEHRAHILEHIRNAKTVHSM